MTRTATRDELVEVAARLIHERGYAATGVASILAAAEAGSGSLYHFFPSKEALLLAVLDRYDERLDEEIVGPVWAATEDPVERVFGILGFYRRFLTATELRLGCPIGNLANELADTHPQVRDRVAGLFARWRTAVEAALEPVQERLPDGVGREGLATLVLSVMEGAVMQARVARSLEPFDTSVAMLRACFEKLFETGGDQGHEE